MKVLLCSPYKEGPDIVRGGINQWGQNILSYYYNHKKNIEIVPISFDRHVSLINSKYFFQRIIVGIKEQINPIHEAIQAIKYIDPDVVHICTSAGLGCLRDYLLVRVARNYHKRSVLHLHFGRLPDLAKKKNWEWYLLNAVIKKCDIVIPMNRPTETALYENGFSNVKYLPNPLSDNIVDKINSLEGKIMRHPKQLLFVGHVYETKGVVELVEGCQNIDGIKLRIVGKYTREMYNKLLSICAKSKDTNWIEFVGEISHEEVLKEFLMADLFVFPSYSEGFPNVILEAMACNCPIIASEVGAIPEMLDINNFPCGICIQPKSSKEVHDAISSLLNDNQRKEEYAIRAKRRVNSMYIMPMVWKELMSIWTIKDIKT